jgi:hypothetical protein
MATDDPYAPFYAKFLEDHPDARRGVAYRTIPGSTEPEVVMTMETMTRFIAWALSRGYVTRPERVPELLGALSRVAEEVRAQQRPEEEDL